MLTLILSIFRDQSVLSPYRGCKLKHVFLALIIANRPHWTRDVTKSKQT
jgi:hypothetical protein